MKNLKLSEKTWLWLRFAALPLMVLVPFFLVKWWDDTAHCFAYAEGDSFVQGLNMGNGPKIFGVLLWIVIGLFLLISFVRAGSKRYRPRHALAKRQLFVSAASLAVTLPIYAVMYHFSQWRYPPSWWCDEQNQLHGDPPGGHFGLGLAPELVSVVVLLYILAPAIAYCLTRNTDHRVGGQKKKELFK